MPKRQKKTPKKKHRALLKRKVFHVWKVRGTTNRDSSPVALSPYDCLRHLTYRPRSPPATQSSKKSTLGPRGFHVGFHPTLGWWFSLIPFLFHHQDSHLQTKKDLTLFALSQLLNEKKLTNVSLSTNHHHPPSFMLLDPQYQPCHCLTARQTLHCWGGSFEHRATPPSSLRCTSMTIGKYGLPRSFPGYWGRGSVVSYIFLFVTWFMGDRDSPMNEPLRFRDNQTKSLNQTKSFRIEVQAKIEPVSSIGEMQFEF